MQFGNPVREQINQLSSFIDATTIYGFTKKHLNFLIASNKMHLKMQDNKFGDFLPTVDQIPSREIKLKFRTAQVFNEMGHEEFVSGDTRVLENPGTADDKDFHYLLLLSPGYCKQCYNNTVISKLYYLLFGAMQNVMYMRKIYKASNKKTNFYVKSW